MEQLPGESDDPKGVWLPVSVPTAIQHATTAAAGLPPRPAAKLQAKAATPSRPVQPRQRRGPGFWPEGDAQVNQVGSLFINTAENFTGGNIAHWVHNWFKISRDSWVLAMVRGVQLDFVGLPVQVREPFPFRLGPDERLAMSGEVFKLEKKGIIERAEPVEGQFLSNVFLRPKSSGGFRLILDLTELNLFLEREHFKMCSFQTALEMMRPGAFMGSVDLRDAYYSVPMAPEFRQFLRFIWEGQLFQFVGMPNGLSSAPRIFTKILTPVFAKLREEGHECFPYIDDSFVIADTQEKCRKSLTVLCNSLDDLGFVIHSDKSVLEPTTSIIFLGFHLNSEEMVVHLTDEKRDKFVRAAEDVLNKGTLSIREVAGLVGLMVAYAPAIDYGAAHIKFLEIDKNAALARCKGNFEGKMFISSRVREYIHWWLTHLQEVRKIRLDSPELEIYTDASLEGWGALCGEIPIGGRWTDSETVLHINALELKAILFGLRSFVKTEGLHIKVWTDSTTALAYTRKMGGVKSESCNGIAREIWEFCESRELWLTIAHIPGVENVTADFKSRNFVDDTEWELSDKLFAKACKLFGSPEVDLFASRLTSKLEKYVSWYPDPDAWRVDAFTLRWTDNFFYIFPPFSLLGKTIQKILSDEMHDILVVPWWASQPWFARLKSLTKRRIHIRSKKGNLANRGRPTNKCLHGKVPAGYMSLLAAKLRKSGYDKQTVDLVLDAWRPSTSKMYMNYLRKWMVFCVEKGCDVYKPSLPQVCQFLKNLALKGLGYGAINTARSALATILPVYEGYTFGKHPIVCALVKGV